MTFLMKKSKQMSKNPMFQTTCPMSVNWGLTHLKNHNPHIQIIYCAIFVYEYNCPNQANNHHIVFDVTFG